MLGQNTRQDTRSKTAVVLVFLSGVIINVTSLNIILLHVYERANLASVEKAPKLQVNGIKYHCPYGASVSNVLLLGSLSVYLVLLIILGEPTCVLVVYCKLKTGGFWELVK